MTEATLTAVIFFFLGLITGSFLNVCIVRLPLETSVMTPRSHCVHCKRTIPWYDNIPLLSYLFLRGRCRFCQQSISFRYFLVELLTGLIFAGFALYFGLSSLLLAYLVMVACFIVATFVDLQHRIIPDEVSVGGMVAGLIFSLFIPELHGIQSQLPSGFKPHFLSLFQSVIGVLIGGGAIYLMGLLGDFIFRKESMGGGDVKLMAMVGSFLGWKMALLTFFVAPFFGAVYGIIEKIRTKDSAIAYGPFLVIGALISLFFGESIISWVMGGYGFYQY
jgi:leader peptidase (prepilin peptidase) / N-methyltransferase